MAERTEARMWRLPIFVRDEVVFFVIEVTVCGSVVPGTAFQCPPIRCPWCLSDSSTYERARARAHTRTYRCCTGTHINEPSCSG